MARLVAGALATFLLLSLVTLSDPKGGDPSPATNQIDQTIADRLHSIDSYFTENAGQVDNEQVRFYSTGGVQAGFAESAVLLKLVEREDTAPHHDFEERMRESQVRHDDLLPSRGIMVRITFPGSKKVMPQGLQEMPHLSNYFIGNDPTKWRTGVRSYREILYSDLYEGIDLSYRTQDGQLKYEFILDPGADPALITASYEGAEGLHIHRSGELVVSTALGELKDAKPIAFQDERRVECTFVQRKPLSFGFGCEGRDQSLPLVIDPLVYATFLGGGSDDEGHGITVDSSGNAYVTGETYSTDFPATLGSFDATYNGGASDAFVAKLDATGSALAYATFLGGGDWDICLDIAVDSSSNAYVTGSTQSADFPATPSSFDTTFNGRWDAFVAKLDATGSALAYATFLGGGNYDEGYGIAVDSSGNAYVTGHADSTDFPATPSSFDTTFNGFSDAFVAKLDATGSALAYATFLGGGGDDSGEGIAVDSSGNAYVTGETYSTDFPATPGSFDTTYNGHDDAFVAKLDATGSALAYATFLGGGGNEVGCDIAVDFPGNAYVTGHTDSPDFPATPGSFDTTFNGFSDAFVAKLDATGSALAYATFLGGSGGEWSNGVAVDSSGGAYISGQTYSMDFPVTPGSFDTTQNGNWDGFMAKLDIAEGANTPPVISSFVASPSPSFEGDTVLLAVNATDADGDALTYSFDFESDGVIDVSGPSSTATHTWGDDFAGKATVKVNDGTNIVEATANVTVLNILPSGSASVTSAQHEGNTIQFSAHVTDPGSDDIFLTWKWGFGAPDDHSTYYNNGVGPDPYPSPDIHPRDITDVKTHTYGDNGAFTVTVFVQDDDSSGNGTTLTTTATPDNLPPSVTVSGGMSISEGQSVMLNATATDPGSDDLTFAWSWGEGSSESRIYYNNGVSPDPPNSPGGTFPFTATDTAIHPYGDNGLFTVSLKVTDDDGGSTTWSGQLTVINLPPVIKPFDPFTVDEGSPLSVSTSATDPGSDDLTFTWSFELGPTTSNIHYNNGVSPDPYPSPGPIYPFTATVNAAATYGDNGVYVLTLTVTDDDGGSASYTTQVTVINLPPVIEPFGPFTVDEGSPLTVAANATDAGSDDLTFLWSFELGSTLQSIHYNDGVGPDPPKSPWGTFPFTAEDLAAHTYGDNGAYNLTLTVTDDDGGSVSSTTNITVLNLPPVIKPFGPFTVNEGDPLSITANATDPGSDDLYFTWTFEYGSTIQRIYYNDGVGPDPPKSPWGTFPFSANDVAAHTYGDNGFFRVTLTVQDDDGGVAMYETTVTVLNVQPTILNAEAFVIANMTLRVAGEKWHDVVLKLYEDGNETGSVRVVRSPGSPNDQEATIYGVHVSLSRKFSAIAYYTPDDDPINGQINGANPAWIIIDWENGQQTRLKHTFNVMHQDTWVWAVDNFNVYALNQNIHLSGTAHDVGSDDLYFRWDSGDGRVFTTVTYNNGVGPDPYPSPDMNPITANSEVSTVYSVTGTYTVVLTVIDDDGGSAATSFTIQVG